MYVKLDKYFCFSETVKTDGFLCTNEASSYDFRCYGCAYIDTSRDIKPLHYDPRETKVEADRRTQEQHVRGWDK